MSNEPLMLDGTYNLEEVCSFVILIIP